MPINIGNLGANGQVTPITSQNHDDFYIPLIASLEYTETYSSAGIRRKTATFGLVDTTEGLASGRTFTIPTVGKVVEFYSDARPTVGGQPSTTQNPAQLIFRGVIVKDPRVRQGVWWNNGVETAVAIYTFDAEAYDNYTLDFDLITARYVSRTAGYIINDILKNKGDNSPAWLTITYPGNIQEGPTIALAEWSNKKRSEIIQELVQKTGFEFFINDNGVTYFYDSSAGSVVNDFVVTDQVAENLRSYEDQSLKIESTDSESINELVVLGGNTPGRKVFDQWKGNKITGKFPLTTIPYGLADADLLVEKWSGTVIADGTWTKNPTALGGSDTSMSADLGRLQINATGDSILISKGIFPREDYVEGRISEVEFQAPASGVLTIGFHSGTNSTTVTEFKQAVEFNGSSLGIFLREGSTLTNSTYSFTTNPSGGSSVYAIRIRLKAGGGATYWIQGGAFGTLGARAWTRLGDTSADTTSFLAFAIRATASCKATLINTFITKRVQVKVTVQDQGSATEDEILIGTSQSQDLTTEAFIQAAEGNATLEFYASDVETLDTRPLGTVRATYFDIQQVRESVYSTSGIGRIKSQSGLATSGDTGLRKILYTGNPTPDRDADALRLAKEIVTIRASRQYRGSFKTNSVLVTNSSQDRPLAGGRCTIVQGNISTQPQVITRVTGRNIGFIMTAGGVAQSEAFEYDVEFGDLGGFIDQQLALRSRLPIYIIDNTPNDPIRRSEVTTATNTRLGITESPVATYGRSNISLSWTAAASPRTHTEVRLDENFGVNAFGLVYNNTGTSFTVTPGGTTPAGYPFPSRRRYTFYCRERNSAAIEDALKYSYRSTIATIENPAPVPRPMKDLTIDRLKGTVVHFFPEYEDDNLERRVYWSNDPNFGIATAYVCRISPHVHDFDFFPPPGQNVYVKYSLWDDWTSMMRDEILTGERVLRLTSDTGVPSAVRNQKCYTKFGSCTSADQCTTATNQNVAANMIRVRFNPPTAGEDSLLGYLIYAATGIPELIDTVVRDGVYVEIDPCSQVATAFASQTGQTLASMTPNQYQNHAVRIAINQATTGNFPDVGAGTLGRMIDSNTSTSRLTLSQKPNRPAGRYKSAIYDTGFNRLPEGRAQIIWVTPGAFRGALPIVTEAEFEAPGQKLYFRIFAFNFYGASSVVVGPCEAGYSDAPSGSLTYTTGGATDCVTNAPGIPSVPRSFSVVSGGGWGDVFAEFIPPLTNGNNILNYQIVWCADQNCNTPIRMKNLGNQLYTSLQVGINRSYWYRVRAVNPQGGSRWVDHCGNIYDCMTGATST